MQFLASDLTQFMNSLLLLFCWVNGAINYAVTFAFGRSAPVILAMPVTIFVIWSDQLRMEDPPLVFTAMGSIGAAAGCYVGATRRAKEKANKKITEKETEQGGDGDAEESV